MGIMIFILLMKMMSGTRLKKMMMSPGMKMMSKFFTLLRLISILLMLLIGKKLMHQQVMESLEVL